MNYCFSNIFFTLKDLSDFKNLKFSEIFIKKNFANINKISEFFKSSKEILYVNGFLGSGKSALVNFSTNLLSKEVIVLKHNGFEANILDDILLSFFNEFKKLEAQNVITEPKIKSENFIQKINSYFSSIDKPFLLILDGFDLILKENKNDIINFISHIAKMPKVKLILISKTIENIEEKIPSEKIYLEDFSKVELEDYLRNNKTRFISNNSQELLDATRGYLYLINLTLIILKEKQIDLDEFLKQFKLSFMSFYTFVKKEINSFIHSKAKNILRFLTLLRHDASVDLLKLLNFYDEEIINLLTKLILIKQENSNLYINEFFKEYIEDLIPSNITLKLHEYIINLYETQLPLKPFERNLLISRQTMRNEIEFHKLFVPKKYEAKEAQNIEYINYSPQKILEKNENEEISKESVDALNFLQQKNIDFKIIKTKDASKLETIEDIMLHVGNLKNNFEYQEAFKHLNNALKLTDDKDFKDFLPKIYYEMALISKKLNDFPNTIKYFEILKNFYEKENNNEIIPEIDLEMAKLYYENFHLENAKEILNELITKNTTPEIFKINSLLILANIEESDFHKEQAFSHYKTALSKISHEIEQKNPKMVGELYFKYALYIDEQNDIDEAEKYYQKCIELGNNNFISYSNFNLGTIYLEDDEINKAMKHFKTAFDIDKTNKNFEGVYKSSLKLANFLKNKDTDLALKYFNISIESAKNTESLFYIASANLSLGDFYYDIKEDEKALKIYLTTLNKVKNDFSKENVEKIMLRINDINIKMGEEKFKQKESEILNESTTD